MSDEFDLSGLFRHEFKRKTVILKDPRLLSFTPDIAKQAYQKAFCPDQDTSTNSSSLQSQDLTIHFLGSSAASTDHDETGLILWPSSVLLASLLLQLEHLIMKCDHICELGAGTAIGGLTAAAIVSAQHRREDSKELRRKPRVVLTDGNDRVMEMLDDLLNDDCWDENGAIDHSIVCATPLLWRETYEDTFLESIHMRRNSIDVVIGADITHWPSTKDALPATIHALLKPQGVAIIVGIIRAQVTHNIMMDGMCRA